MGPNGEFKIEHLAPKRYRLLLGDGWKPTPEVVRSGCRNLHVTATKAD